MDALRKAEADKKAAAARAAGALSGDAADATDQFARSADELRLEPLGDRAGDDLNTSRSGEFGASGVTPRLSASSRFRPVATDATLADALSFPAEPAAPPAADGGSLTRPELVTARTVFAATARRRANPLAWGIGTVLLLSCAGAGVLGYRYYTQAPAPIVIPSPSVALGVERGTDPSRAAPPATPAAAAPPPATVPAEHVADAPPAADASADIAADMRTVATRDDPAPQTSVAPPAASAAPPAPPAPPFAPAQRPRPATLPQDFEMQNGDLRIARSTRTAEDARRQLTAAYAAFEAGDLATARRGYVAVLKRIPAQRDALLGLGAIALAGNRLAEAHAYYSAVLAEVPDHPAATAAMFLIEGGRGPHATETKLKMLLDRGLDAPYLHFALGNLYAREQRWGDAQQAYFEAFRAQPRNADYAFNLAVSLDQLGQRAAALDFYRQAEALRGPHTVFNGAAVAARIAALSGP